MPWTTEQKIFIVKAYFRLKSIHAAQLQFKERFGCRECPVHSMIYRWVNKFRIHGTVYNLNRKDTHTITHWTTEIIKDTTQRSCCQRLCCPQPKQVCASAKSGAWNQPGVRAENFDGRSPRVSLQDTEQKLTPDDIRKRVVMCQWFCDMIDAVPDFLTMSGFRTRHISVVRSREL